MALATFTDGSEADVTAQTTTTTWTSSAPAVASVSATGLVRALTVGNTSIRATFRRSGQEFVSAPVVVHVDRLVTDAQATQGSRAITVVCTPYGDLDQAPATLACLPSGLNFEVHCRAFGEFVSAGPDFDITDQVTWASSNTGVARPTGLVAFLPEVRQSFRMANPGTAVLSARLGSQSSLTTTATAGTVPYVVQSAAQTVTDLQIAPGSPSVQVDEQVQLQAIATLTGTGTCATPPTRDFSILVDWNSANESRAEVSFFGQATGIAQGTVNISATYGTMPPVTDTVPLVVNP